MSSIAGKKYKERHTSPRLLYLRSLDGVTILSRLFGPAVLILDRFGSKFNGIIPEPCLINSERLMTMALNFLRNFSNNLTQL